MTPKAVAAIERLRRGGAQVPAQHSTEEVVAA
jgi:hypothetical protein